MYQRILAALDGSDLSEEVLPHVEALAKKFGSTVLLLRVHPLLSAGAVAAAPPQDPTQVHRAELQAAESYLTAVAERLRARGCQVETELRTGSPAEEIIARAQATGADLIAMTTHGRGGLGRLVFGSVTSAVLPKAPCPMLVVRARGAGR
jgi:nucleotide-binding universal stress UspA family protein